MRLFGRGGHDIFRKHPVVWGSALVALVSTFIALGLDTSWSTTLSRYPVSANVLATVLSISYPVLFGALFFNRWQEAEDKRHKHRVEQALKIETLVNALSPRMARTKARIQECPLIRDGDDGIDALASALELLHQAFTPIHAGGIPLSDDRIPVSSLKQLALFATALDSIRETIDSFDEPLLSVGSLANRPDLQQAIVRTVLALEHLRYEFPRSSLKIGPLLTRMLVGEGVGSWDGRWVAMTDGSGYRLSLTELQQLTAAAHTIRTSCVELDLSISELEGAVGRELKTV